MKKWTFFFAEGNVSSQVKTDEEDKDINEKLNKRTPENFLSLAGDKMDIFINLALVKCATREVVEDCPEVPQEPQPELIEALPAPSGADLHPQSPQI